MPVKYAISPHIFPIFKLTVIHRAHLITLASPAGYISRYRDMPLIEHTIELKLRFTESIVLPAIDGFHCQGAAAGRRRLATRFLYWLPLRAQLLLP